MYNRNRGGFFGGLSGGLFLIFLAIAFHYRHFLPMLFVGLAAAAFFGSMASGRPQAVYGGIQGAVFHARAGLFVPDQLVVAWDTVVLGISAILGALGPQIIAALGGMGIMGMTSMMNQPPQYHHHSTSRRSINRLSRQLRLCRHIRLRPGYQPPQDTYQEGGQSHPYPEQPTGQYPSAAKSCASTRDAATIGNLHIVQD